MEIPQKYQSAPEGHALSAPFRVLLNRMIHAIDNNLPSPAPNFQDGVNSQIMLDAVRLSAMQGRWVDL
jgi:predicted dehydrogenase